VTQGQAEESGVALRANMLVSLVLGRWQRYAKSGFKQSPSEHAPAQLAILLS